MSDSQPWNEETLVENRMIEQLQTLGYTYIQGQDLQEERTSQSEVVLMDRLTKTIKSLNPWLDDNNLNRVIRRITHMEATSVMEANQAFHDMLINKMSITQDLGTGRKNHTVQVIDFDNIENNDFIVTNQISYTHANVTNRPDLILYVNGLPLVVIECKSPRLQPDEQIGQGVTQLLRYQKENELLFYYNQFLIATSNDRAKVGTIGAKVQHYSAWKEPYPLKVEEGDSAQDILTLGILEK